jgi:riboflavin synthase
MFTGIIKYTGQIKAVHPVDSGFSLIIQASPELAQPLAPKTNLSIDGRVFTVLEKRDGQDFILLHFFLSHIQSPQQFQPGRQVNLERAICLGEEIPGPLFYGIPSGQGQVTRLETTPTGTLMLDLHWDNPVLKYLDRGDQVCVDGVLLRIKALEASALTFELYHPDALQLTNLARSQSGDWVNIEVDPMIKKIGQVMERHFPATT